MGMKVGYYIRTTLSRLSEVHMNDSTYIFDGIMVLLKGCLATAGKPSICQSIFERFLRQRSQYAPSGMTQLTGGLLNHIQTQAILGSANRWDVAL